MKRPLIALLLIAWLPLEGDSHVTQKIYTRTEIVSSKNSDQKSHTGKVPRLLRVSAPGSRPMHGVRLFAVAVPERTSITDRDTTVRTVRTSQRSRLTRKYTDVIKITNESQRRKTPMITVRVNIPFEQYKECFVKNYQGPYIIQQKPGSPWKTVNKNISDDVILAHLDGTIWAGVRAPWYITYGIIDFDCPENDIVRKTVEHLRMRESNYLLVTSPSFRQDGSVHLIFPVEYSNALTASRYQKLFAEYMTGEFSGVEIYPHPHRPIRLPFGKDQYIIDDCGAPLDQSC